GYGISRSAMEDGSVTVRSRRGGERMRLGRDRPTRPLKRLLQDAGIPPWQRASWPLVYCGSTLAALPRLGVHAAFQAEEGAPGLDVTWRAQAWRSDPAAAIAHAREPSSRSS